MSPPSKWYWAAVALRVVLALVPGSYVHPDELHQSPEVMASDVLGLATQRAWEWAGDALPIRSPAAPLLTSGLPYWLLSLAGSPITPYAVWVVPRLWMLALSLAADRMLWRVCVRLRLKADAVLLVHASMWPTLVLASRPLSNSLEAFLLVLLFFVAVDWRPVVRDAARRNLALGVLLGLGFFVRVTFAAFALPVVALLLHDDLRLLLARDLALQRARAPPVAPSLEEELFGYVERRRDGFPVAAVNARQRNVHTLRWFIEVLLGALLTAIALFFADSLYFGSLGLFLDERRLTFGPALAALAAPQQWPRLHLAGDLVLTPLNFVRYNTRPSSWAQHGEHPYWTHALVNLPLLAGPLAVIAAVTLLRSRSRLVERVLDSLSTESRFEIERAEKELVLDERDGAHAPPLVRAAAASLVLGLAALSAVPHQEPRFLLPLCAPLALLFGPRVAEARRPARALWVAFNLLMVAVMGVAHQGGVVRACLAADELARDALFRAAPPSPSVHVDARVSLFFFHTYPPPHAMLMLPHTRAALHPRALDVTVAVESGTAAHLFDRLAAAAAGVSGAPSASSHATARPRAVLLFVPGAVHFSVPGAQRRRLRRVAQVFPHLSFEHLPGGDSLAALVDEASLHIYEYGAGETLDAQA
jgi:phosphatidylinositol glycan class Z